MKTTIKLIGFIVFLALIAFPLSALGGADKSKNSGADRRADLKGAWVVPGGYYPTIFELYYEVEEDGTVITELSLSGGGGSEKFYLVSYDGTTVTIGNDESTMTGTAKIKGNTLIISGLKDDDDKQLWLAKFNATYEKHEAEQSYDDGER
jgi:hypothetical protein